MMLPPKRTSRRAFVRSVAAPPLLALAGDFGTAKGSLPLAVRGKSSYSIFLSTGASPSELWAAAELQQHIELMTGVRLPIEIGSGLPASPNVVAVGRGALVDKLGIETPEGESCLLRTVGGAVVIAGGRQRGTMYGVSVFLEKLGCRWFTPDVSRVPRRETLALPELHEVHTPAFEYREVFLYRGAGKRMVRPEPFERTLPSSRRERRRQNRLHAVRTFVLRPDSPGSLLRESSGILLVGSGQAAQNSGTTLSHEPGPPRSGRAAGPSVAFGTPRGCRCLDFTERWRRVVRMRTMPAGRQGGRWPGFGSRAPICK